MSLISVFLHNIRSKQNKGASAEGNASDIEWALKKRVYEILPGDVNNSSNPSNINQNFDHILVGVNKSDRHHTSKLLKVGSRARLVC